MIFIIPKSSLMDSSLVCMHMDKKARKMHRWDPHLHVEGCSPGIEIEFLSLGFHLRKLESNKLDFNIIELEP